MDHKIVDFTPEALYLNPMIHDLDARGLLCPLPVLKTRKRLKDCLLYTSPSPRDLSTSRMPSSA